jgi:hypothetical protein
MTLTMQADMRAAAVTLLEAYATAQGLKLQVYPGRPRSVNAPCAFVDRMTATFVDIGITLRQTTHTAEVLVLHGLFDSKDATEQRDAFVDGFSNYVATQFHAAGTNTLIAAASLEDEPDFTTDWMPPEQQRTYYATRITLEGFASG